MTGTCGPLCLFAVVLMVFLGKEGPFEMLPGCMDGKGLEISPLVPPHLTLSPILT